MKPKLLPSVKELKKLFTYDVKTGVGYWKESRGVITKGDLVGTRHAGGYNQVGVNGKTYLWHRILCKLHFKEFDETLCVDHINGNRQDNNLKNLRFVTPSENQKNMKLFSKNTSGKVGVFWHTARKKWCATITINYKTENLGQFKFKNDAIEARINAEQKAGFHLNHGRSTLKKML